MAATVVMTRRSFIALAILVVLFAGLLRTVWLTSDPPSTAHAGVGIVWHDEGAWVHNARNRALWGTWRTDNWNPMFLTPVFTGLEYVAFRTADVGTWQARTVPALSGLVAVIFLIAGLSAVGGRSAALVGGVLLSANYVSVMWNRAALMESTMTAFVVMGWGAYAMSARRPAWGIVAGVAAILAFFTKASAAFFIAAIGCEALMHLGRRDPFRQASHRVMAGLAIGALLAGVLFVIPHWSEFRFYNWQMSVTRKPSYTLTALMMRASWLPLVHDFFTWMWPIFVVACVSIISVVLRWRSAHAAERLLVLWVLVGFLELIVHDSGNERRYVMFIPALIALASTWLLSLTRTQPALAGSTNRAVQALVVACVLALGYLTAASAVRAGFLPQVHAGHLHTVVVLSAAIAVIAALSSIVWWKRTAPWLAFGGQTLPRSLAVAIVVVPLAGDLLHFTQWAAGREDLNYRSSIKLARLLPAGTLVQGKLANGMALETRIKPIFIGHEFGNYDDRLQRDDVRYILTYISPSVGFESQAGSDMIQQILNRYPARRVIATFDVDETGGPDRAALIDKAPGTIVRAPD